MANSLREEKNKRISASFSATKKRRKTQIPVTIELGVRNEKRNRKTGCMHHLKMICVEAKWMTNDITNRSRDDKDLKISNLKDKDFKQITHLDKDGNKIVSDAKYLTSTLRKGVIEKYRDNLSGLHALKKNGHKTGRIKFKSEIKTVYFMQYGISHKITGQNSIQIQGFRHDIRVSGLKQLRKLEEAGINYEIATANLHMVCENCFKFFLTVWVDRDEYYAFKENKKQKRVQKRLNEGKQKQEINGYDLGCESTATDAYGTKYNVLFEESTRMKALKRHQSRQIDAAKKKDEKEQNKTKTFSANRYDTKQKLRKLYYKMSRRKDAAAIELSLEILDMNDVVIIQDEQISNWKRKKKIKKSDGKVVKRRGSGRKVQKGILGRLKKRLKASS